MAINMSCRVRVRTRRCTFPALPTGASAAKPRAVKPYASCQLSVAAKIDTHHQDAACAVDSSRNGNNVFRIEAGMQIV